MNSRAPLVTALAVLAGVGVGYALREPMSVAPSRPIAPGDSNESTTLDQATLERLVAVLEALERRLADPRVGAAPLTARDVIQREPASTETRSPAAPDTAEMVAVLRSIDARLARLASGGGLDSTSLSLGEPSEKRKAWVELARRKDPIRPAEILSFLRENLEQTGGQITAELFFVEPWDIIRRFGWPSEVERGSIDSGSWYLSYSGLSLVSKLEEEPLVEVSFQFQAGQLIDVDWDTE